MWPPRRLARTARLKGTARSLNGGLGIASLLAWLDDLKMVLSAHACQGVADSLQRWQRWAETCSLATADPGTIDNTTRAAPLRTAGRAILSGEKRHGLLRTGDYVARHAGAGGGDHSDARLAALVAIGFGRSRRYSARVTSASACGLVGSCSSAVAKLGRCLPPNRRMAGGPLAGGSEVGPGPAGGSAGALRPEIRGLLANDFQHDQTQWP